MMKKMSLYSTLFVLNLFSITHANGIPRFKSSFPHFYTTKNQYVTKSILNFYNVTH